MLIYSWPGLRSQPKGGDGGTLRRVREYREHGHDGAWPSRSLHNIPA